MLRTPRRAAPAAALCVLLVTGSAGAALAAEPAATVGAAGVTAAAPQATRAAAPPSLRYGMRSEVVKIVQRELGVTPVSGWFGPRTLAAVKAFQARNGIDPIGVVGPRTWAALGDGPSQEAIRLSTPAAVAATDPEPAPAAAPAATPAADPAADPATSAEPAAAPAAVGGKVCPTENFTWGDGFGASRWHGAHQGVDLMGTRGTPIYAVESGYILREGRQSNGALRIVLQGRSGSKYYYGHMDKDLVDDGDKVTAGDVIGLMGDTGAPGAVHLHFEYWKSGGESDAIDPEPLLRSIC